MTKNVITFDTKISHSGGQKVIYIPKSLNLMAEQFNDGVQVTIIDKGEKQN